jgi:conjugal transfer pilus assembly protein TraU
MPKKGDKPSNPICMCTKSNIPIPGITIGFWEPVRLVDVTRIPYCMTNLGGISFGSDYKRIGSYIRSYTDHIYNHDSFITFIICISSYLLVRTGFCEQKI